MIFLLLAIVSSALVSVVMRLSTGKVKNNIGMLCANYLTCTITALAYAGFRLAPASEGLLNAIFLGGINGFLYLASFVVFQYSVKKSGVVLSSVFMKLGMLVPLVLSVILFGETPTLIQIIGFVLAIIAIIMINQDGKEKGRASILNLILLLLLGGSAEGMSKVFEEVGSSALSAQFLFYTVASALVLCLFFMLAKHQKIGKNEAIYGVLVGVPNFFSAKFVLRALAHIPAIIVFPSFAVATILTVSLVGVLVFKERLSRLGWSAVGIIIVTLALLNI